MLKTLFAAVLLFAFITTANATPIKTGINGTFDIMGQGPITTDANGIITSIGFGLVIAGATNEDDFRNYWVSTQLINTPVNPLSLSNSIDQVAFSFSGFNFTVKEIKNNISKKQSNTDLYDANLVLIGNLSHNDFITTPTQFHFSTQALVKNGTTNNKGFSITVSSPAPISEPGALVIFGLALVFFAANRKKTHWLNKQQFASKI